MSARRVGVAGLLALAAVVAPGLAADRVAPDLRAVLDPDDAAPIRVIVHFSDHAPLDQHRAAYRGDERREALIRALQATAAASQRSASQLLAGRTVAEPSVLWAINALAVQAPARVILELSGLPEVERIVADREILLPRAAPTKSGGPAPAAGPTEWNLDAIGAPVVWDLGFTGAGIVIATLDTGADGSHQDLGSRWRGGTNSWFDPSGQHSSPHDGDGHGTQVLGVLVGGDAGGTGIGVAPGAAWIAAKIFNDAGVASYSAIHQAFQWVMDPDANPTTNDAADVVNNSWGLVDGVDQCIAEFRADVQALEAAGIAVVFSAGNAGPDSATSLSPGNYPESLAVGATDLHDAVDVAGSRGPSACDGTYYPELAAPGVDIRSADLTLGGVFPDSYIYITGTSFAAPHVAGAIALLLQAFPTASAANVEFALKTTAFDLAPVGPDNDSGHGLLDVSAAYDFLALGGLCSDPDGDGVSTDGGLCGPVDCAETSATSWESPGEVQNLLFPSRQTLTWVAPLQAGGVASALRYDVLRSADPRDFVSAATCVASGIAGRQAPDPTTPATGTAFHYVVRAENGCPAPGSLGRRSNGAERSGRACP